MTPRKTLNLRMNKDATETSVNESNATHTPYADLSRYANLFGVRGQVHLDQRVLDNHHELDSALGQNVAGAVLSVLGCRVARGDIDDDRQLTVSLRRRDGDRIVEVDLAVLHRRRAGT